MSYRDSTPEEVLGTPPSGVPSAAGTASTPPRKEKGKVAPPCRRIPYPLKPPAPEVIRNWDDYLVWAAAPSKARDNYSRTWWARGAVLPPASDEWDTPIPYPRDAGPRPAVSLKSIQIPKDMSFEDYRLMVEEQARYEE